MLRLNLGCGFFKRDGWVNIDADPAYGPDIVADCTRLPYDDQTVDEIYAGHILEHIEESLRLAPLREWKRVLKSGGKIVVVVPDVFRSLCTLYFDIPSPGGVTIPSAILGTQETIWQCHHRTYNEGRLIAEMESVFGMAQVVLDEEIPWQVGAESVRRGYDA